MPLEDSRHAENASSVTADLQMRLLQNNLKKIIAENNAEKTKSTKNSDYSSTESPEIINAEGVLDKSPAEDLIPQRFTRIPFSGPVPVSAFNQVADTCDIPMKFYQKMEKKERQKAEKLRPFTSSLNSPGHPLSPYKRSSSPWSKKSPSKHVYAQQDQDEKVRSPTDQSKLFLITSFFGGIDNLKSPATPTERNPKSCCGQSDRYYSGKRGLRHSKYPVSPLFHPVAPLASPTSPISPFPSSPLRQSSYAFEIKSPKRRRFRLPSLCQSESSYEPRYDLVSLGK
jgi:hypothetical protein